MFELKLCCKEQLTHDTYRYEFKFPDPEWYCGLWPGGHFNLNMRVDDVWIGRNYTPISAVNQKGAVTFVIKTYREDPE